MLDDVRKYVEAALGSLNQSRAREMASSLLRGRQSSGQVNRLAQELVGWSQRTRERIAELVQAEVRKQLRAAGVATRDDLDTLRARVRELEKGGTSGSSRSPSKRSSGKRSSAKSTSSKRSSAKSSSAKSSSARRSSTTGSGAQGSSGST